MPIRIPAVEFFAKSGNRATVKFSTKPEDERLDVWMDLGWDHYPPSEEDVKECDIALTHFMARVTGKKEVQTTSYVTNDKEAAQHLRDVFFGRTLE